VPKLLLFTFPRMKTSRFCGRSEPEKQWPTEGLRSHFTSGPQEMGQGGAKCLTRKCLSCR
jgi:hypothetical protein